MVDLLGESEAPELRLLQRYRRIGDDCHRVPLAQRCQHIPGALRQHQQFQEAGVVGLSDGRRVRMVGVDAEQPQHHGETSGVDRIGRQQQDLRYVASKRGTAAAADADTGALRGTEALGDVGVCGTGGAC